MQSKYDWKLRTITLSLLAVLFSPFLGVFLPDYSTYHFYLTGSVLLAYVFLFGARSSRHGYRFSFLSVTLAANLAFVIILYLLALWNDNLNRTCYSIIVVTLLLFIGPNVIGIAKVEIVEIFEKSLIVYLTLFTLTFAILVLVGRFIEEPYFLIINTRTGLITPIATCSYILALRNRKFTLFLTTSLMLYTAFISHYQTSYMIAIFVTLGVAFGYRVIGVFSKVFIIVIMMTYCVASIFTDLILNILRSSAENGYDNVTVRISFAEHALDYLRDNLVFGGALSYPLTISIKIGSTISELPLHSDALTLMLGFGAVGWFLNSLAQIAMVSVIWKTDSSTLELCLAGAIIANFLTGIVNPQYGTYSYLFTMLLTVVVSMSSRTAREFAAIRIKA